MVFMPPRHGKSELISHYFPAWVLGNWPYKQVILASYEADFAESWGRKARGVLTEVGNDVFGVSLDGRQSAAKSWAVSQGGSMNTAGVGGPMTGKGAHILVIDDPVKNFEEAMSPTARKRAWEWWQSVAYTRLEPGAAAVIMMTRWHEDDLAGRILEESDEAWEIISMPAIADTEDDPIGRQLGQALCPQRYTEKDFDRIRNSVGKYVWQSLYQQQPSAFEGSIIMRKWWSYYVRETLPKSFDEIIQSWDMTFKDTKQSDFVVGQVWGRRKANRYLLDQVRDRMTFTETQRAVQKLSKKWPLARRKLIEAKANGPAVIDSLTSTVPGLIPYDPKDSKEARVFAVTPNIESGNIWIPHKNIATFDVQEFVDECARFPTGMHDDQVDAMTQALLYWEENNMKASDLLSVWEEDE
jgi:predicted phage terminase large subunit-like protein